ncbi:MAG: TldD/PmbA family protein [Deltaproteobacteria bacterium]
MFNHPFALELAYIAVEEAIRLGASYADARYEYRQHEDVTTRNGALHQAGAYTERGLGLRVLVHGAWGYVGVSEPNRHDVAVSARRAVELARATAIVQEHPVALVDNAPQRSIYRTQIKRDPLAVPLEDKVELLFSIDEKLRKNDKIVLAEGSFSAHRQRKVFVSSEGAELDQELVYTGVGYRAGASDGDDLQFRSFPAPGRGTFMGKGWELVSESALLDNAERVAEEAVALLSAEACPAGNMALVLTADTAAHQLRHTCAQLLELDRVLGYARSESGGSIITTDRLGSEKFASDLVTIYADAREPGGAGTFGYDDEGVEAQRVDLVTDGRCTGFLSSRESAFRVGLERSQGSMRAASWGHAPSVRVTNVSLAPGKGGDLDAIISDTEDGILMDTGSSFSTDGDGRTFVTTTEQAWRIKNGKRAGLLKNPSFSGDTLGVWQNVDVVGGQEAWQFSGSLDQTKGRPLQIVPVGHGAPPIRISDVQIGVVPAGIAVVPNGERIETIGGKSGGGRRSSKRRGGKRRGTRKRTRKKDTK